MKRLALLLILAGLSGTVLADDPAFCKSMCASDKNQCLASVKTTEKREAAFASTGTSDKNPFARAAQTQVRSSDNGALERSGDQYRREARTGACDTAFQRCTRSCTALASDAVGEVVSRHAKKAD